LDLDASECLLGISNGGGRAWGATLPVSPTGTPQAGPRHSRAGAFRVTDGGSWRDENEASAAAIIEWRGATLGVVISTEASGGAARGVWAWRRGLRPAVRPSLPIAEWPEQGPVFSISVKALEHILQSLRKFESSREKLFPVHHPGEERAAYLISLPFGGMQSVSV